MVLEFKKCCYCIELRRGCLIIGYINLVCSLIMILLLGCATARLENAADFLGGAFSDSVAFVVQPIMLVVVAVFVGFTTALLIGVHRNKREYVGAYLIYSLFFIVLYIIMFCASFTGSRYNTDSIVKDVHSMLWNTYFFMVVRSYYLQMTPTIQPNQA